MGQTTPSYFPAHTKPSVLNASTPKHPDLSSAAKVTSPPSGLALGWQVGLSHEEGSQDLLALTDFPHAPKNDPECDIQEY